MPVASAGEYGDTRALSGGCGCGGWAGAGAGRAPAEGFFGAGADACLPLPGVGGGAVLDGDGEVLAAVRLGWKGGTGLDCGFVSWMRAAMDWRRIFSAG
jgi:hypothetical protein